jgi:hypothetical protein
MNNSHAILRSLILSAVLLTIACLGIGCGDDDKAVNPPAETTPTALVGTWWYASGTQDGVPIPSFAEVSFTDSSQAGSVSFTSNATWNTREYYNSQIVYTRSGTLRARGDTLKITTLIDNGEPQPANDTSSSIWDVVGDSLWLTSQAVVFNDTIIIIVRYTKE